MAENVPDTTAPSPGDQVAFYPGIHPGIHRASTGHPSCILQACIGHPLSIHWAFIVHPLSIHRTSIMRTSGMHWAYSIFLSHLGRKNLNLILTYVRRAIRRKRTTLIILYLRHQDLWSHLWRLHPRSTKRCRSGPASWSIASASPCRTTPCTDCSSPFCQRLDCSQMSTGQGSTLPIKLLPDS